jgi:hypothetical protein
MNDETKTKASLRPLDERSLARVRGGMLYPAVKLLDATTGVLASDIYIKFDGIDGEAR